MAELPPGPRLPRAIQTLRFVRDPLPMFERAAARFGETFTLRLHGPGDLVFITDPPSLKRLFAADRVNTIAPGRNIILRPVMGPHSVLLAEDEEHMRRRKLMLPPFHGERMRAYESVIVEATERELERWPAGEPFRLHPRMQAITLEVILRAVFGVEDAGRRDELRGNLVDILATTRSPLAVGLVSRRTRRLPPWRRAAERIERTDELLAAEIARHRADPDVGRREDILSMLIAAEFDDGSRMGDDDIRDQLMTLLLAGHETTATALAWAFDLLFHRPEAMERLRAEIAGDGDGAYLDAVIDETLRLRPVVPFTGRQLRRAMSLGGHELPAGAVVMAAIYLTHMREDIYPEARSFRPERFLGEKPDTFAWIPFGGGTRRCLGAAFAQFEMRVALRTILERAVLRPASERPERIVRRNVTLAPATGTGAVLERRI
jgi:cytochrome P450